MLLYTVHGEGVAGTITVLAVYFSDKTYRERMSWEKDAIATVVIDYA